MKLLTVTHCSTVWCKSAQLELDSTSLMNTERLNQNLIQYRFAFFTVSRKITRQLHCKINEKKRSLCNKKLQFLCKQILFNLFLVPMSFCFENTKNAAYARTLEYCPP